MANIERWFYRFKRVLFGFSPKLCSWFGIDFRFSYPNREFLEGHIFPWLNSRGTIPIAFQKWLFIGVARYTWHYHKLTHAQFFTIDNDLNQVRFGQKNFHTIGSALELSHYYPANHFDVVIANGVVGWGTNDVDSFHQLIDSTASVLKPGGILLLGYNDEFKNKVFDIEEQMEAHDSLEAFIPNLQGMTSNSIVINDLFQHHYVFYTKKYRTSKN